MLWDAGDTGEVPSGLHCSRLETMVQLRWPSSSPLPSLAVHDREFGGEDGCTASLTLPVSARLDGNGAGRWGQGWPHSLTTPPSWRHGPAKPAPGELVTGKDPERSKRDLKRSQPSPEVMEVASWER